MLRTLALMIGGAILGSSCTSVAESEVVVVRELTFLREVEDGVSSGFNLDGAVSDEGDPEGCYRSDLVSPDGTPGIDNAFSNVLPALELTEASALEPLIKAAIDEGRLLLMLEMSGIDDRVSDDCVDMHFSRSIGPPALGGDGFILPGQTYEYDGTAPESFIDCGVLSLSLIHI